jgi:uncharacterized membrane protein YhaH (DUF805 family)
MQNLSPIEWAQRPLKKYADFGGRASRAEYWWFWLAYMLLNVILQVLVRISAIFGLLGLLYLGILIPVIAVGVRRLHDTERTGWWLLAPFVPYAIGIALVFRGAMTPGANPLALFTFGPAMIFMLIGFVLALVVFIFTVLPGTKGPNRFGPDPYDEDNLEEVFA